MAVAPSDLYPWLFSSNPPNNKLKQPLITTQQHPCSRFSSSAKRSPTTTTTSLRRGALPTTTKKDGHHFLKLLNRSCKAGNYGEGLYFLECMISKGHKPGVIHCTKLIKGFSSDPRSIAKAGRVMEILEQHGAPDTYAYNALIGGKAANQIDSAIAVLDRMRSHGCSPDIVTYNILIGALCARGKLALAMKLSDRLLLEENNTNNCQPTVVTYTILIEASIAEGGIAEAIDLLEQMSSRGLSPDNYTFNTILRGMCREGLVDGAWELVRSLPSTVGCQPDVISCNILLRGLLGLKRWEDAEKLIAEMVSAPADRSLRPNVVTYSILISSLCQEGMVDEAVQLLEDMMDAGLKPDTYCYDPLVSAYCKQGRMDLAIEFMISNGCLPDIVNYNTILASLCKSGNVDQALHVFNSLEDMGCPPNTSSYNAIIGGLWNGGDRRRALELVSAMIKIKGVEPDEVTYNVLISCLCRDGMVDEALHLMKDMKTGGFRPTIITYNTLILGMCKVQRVDIAIDMFADMVERKCRPNESTYVILVEGIAYAGHGAEAAELGNALISWNAISRDSIKRMKKTFPAHSSSGNKP